MRVLIAEDDSGFAAILSSHLKRESIDVVVVRTVIEGVRAIDQDAMHFDVALIDLWLPTRSDVDAPAEPYAGVQLAEHLASRSPSTRIIAISQIADARTTFSISARFEAFIEKHRLVKDPLGVLSSFLPVASRGKSVQHVVIPIHGIRDYAEWYQIVERAFPEAHFVVTGPKFGWFDPLRFLCPLDLTAKPRKRVVDHIRGVRQTYPEASISIIAHSFGSYLAVTALEQEHDLRVHRLILCGAVVTQEFQWERIKEQIGPREVADKRRFIINDCGDADYWPAMGRAAGWRYGNAGTHAVGHYLVTDRFHAGDHGLFFDDQFVRQYWRTFIESGLIVQGTASQAGKIGWLWLFFARLPLRWLILTGAMLCLIAAAGGAVALFRSYLSVLST